MNHRQIGFLLLVLVAFSPGLSAQDADEWFGFDKKLHLGASVLISGYGYGMSSIVLEHPWQRAIAGASLGLAFGASKELVDLMGVGHPSWRDVTWNVVGVVIGVGVSVALDYILEAIFIKAKAY